MKAVVFVGSPRKNGNTEPSVLCYNNGTMLTYRGT